YLGLANDPRLRKAAIAAITEFGVGAGASRLISGTQSPHVRLEQALAKWKGTEAALCFSSGYAAALGTIPALVTKDDVIVLEKRFDALLILDEAHADGVIGPNGRGLAAAENLGDEVDVQMGTLSKALGASGGYICGSHDLIEWLINCARSFIYSTAPPPAIAAAASAAIDFLSSSEGEARRLLLWKKIELLDRLMPANAMNTKSSAATSAIFPWIVGDEQAALNLASALQSEGFLLPEIGRASCRES